MCMIIYKPAGVCPPSFKLLEEFTCRNPHGFGSAVFDGGSPSLLKTLDSSLFLILAILDVETLFLSYDSSFFHS